MNESISTMHPMMIRNVNAVLRELAPAIKPTRGGPTSKPKKPMALTVDKARLGDMALDLLAALYASGTTDETPSPTIKNPIIAVNC